jgi:hypothetical protein
MAGQFLKNILIQDNQSRNALKDAVEDEILESNSLSGWAYKNREQFKEEDAPFTG